MTFHDKCFWLSLGRKGTASSCLLCASFTKGSSFFFFFFSCRFPWLKPIGASHLSTCLWERDAVSPPWLHQEHGILGGQPRGCRPSHRWGRTCYFFGSFAVSCPRLHWACKFDSGTGLRGVQSFRVPLLFMLWVPQLPAMLIKWAFQLKCRQGEGEF